MRANPAKTYKDLPDGVYVRVWYHPLFLKVELAGDLAAAFPGYRGFFGKPPHVEADRLYDKAEFILTSSGAPEGFGPLLYDVAMEVAGDYGLAPDRYGVSYSALAVWEYYYKKRRDVDKVHSPRPSRARGMLSPQDPCLDYIYYKNTTATPVLDGLRAAGKLEWNDVQDQTPASELKRNPPDAQYTKWIGAGAFSSVYGRPIRNLRMADFFTDEWRNVRLAKGPHAIEVITRKGCSELGDYDLDCDASKTVLICARELLKNQPKALAYLPNIQPLRIDNTENPPELVYTMPVYKPWIRNGSAYATEVASYIAGFVNLEVTLQKSMTDALERAKREFSHRYVGGHLLDAQVVEEFGYVTKVFEALINLQDLFEFSTYQPDMHRGNLAVDRYGHLILLDPIIATAAWADVIEYWRQRGWAETQLSKKLAEASSTTKKKRSKK